MQAYLYINNSDNNVLSKNITTKKSIDVHFKEDSPIEEPLLYISRNINMKNFNYLEVPDFHRFYYIEKCEVSTQRYIVTCKSDPLMSWKTQLLKKKVLLDRSAENGKFDFNLEDDRYKVRQYTHTDVYTFRGSDAFDPSKQEFLLAVCGNPAVNANVSPSGDGGGKVNNGGSTVNHNTMDEIDYENLTPEEKNDDTITVVPEGPFAAPAFEQGTLYYNIKESQYNNLDQETKNNGTFYLISDRANGVKGNRVIQITESIYNELRSSAKNNNSMYYVR